jgi:hypothetical protein
VQVINGGVQILTTLCCVPMLIRRMGILAAFRGFSWPLVPYLVLFPAVALLNGSGPGVVFAAMSFLVATRTVLFAIPFATIMMAVNNLSPPQHLGEVVSSAQAVASAIRTVGPAFGGALFSLAAAQDAWGSWRLEGVYFLMSVLALATFVCAAYIPATCEHPPGEAAEVPCEPA